MSIEQSISVEDRLIRCRTDIPADPPAGDYVVVDVTHFSTTVAELLTNGVSYIHVTNERGDEFEYQQSVPEALIGGGKTEEYVPHDGYDFFNSPSYVQDLELTDRPTAMTSKNGGRAVTTLKNRGDDGVEVFVGGYTNAEAIGTFLRKRERPTFIVAAGSSGAPTTDDLLGATLIDRYLRNEPLDAIEQEHYIALLEVSKGPEYADKHETRQRDLHEFATDINSRRVVPHLQDGKLVRARDP